MSSLPFYPINALLRNGLVSAGITVRQLDLPITWHGRVVDVLTRTVVCTGALVIAVIALVEAVVFGIFGLLAIGRNWAMDWPDFGKRDVAVLFGTSVCSFVMVIIALTTVFQRNFPESHELHFYGDRLIYGVGVFVSQIIRPEPNDLSVFIQPILAKLQADPNLQPYFQQNPADLQLLQGFNRQRLAIDLNYQNDIRQVIQRLMAHFGLGQLPPMPNFMQAANPHSRNVQPGSVQEQQYWDGLKSVLEESFVGIYNDDTLSGYLDGPKVEGQASESGKDRMMAEDPCLYTRLPQYVQFKELCNPISCPNAQRKLALDLAKGKVDLFSFAQKKELERKILDENFDSQDSQVMEVYRLIGSLSTPMTGSSAGQAVRNAMARIPQQQVGSSSSSSSSSSSAPVSLGYSGGLPGGDDGPLYAA